MRTQLAAALLLLATFVASAAEIAGVRIDDKTRVANAELALNGAGLRKRVFFQVYAIGLYLPQKSSSAAEVAGVKIEDKTRVGNAELVLNGAGLRKRAFFQVYAIGLYLPQKSSSASEVLQQPGPKHIAIHMLRDVGADTFTEALADGIRANHSEAEAKALEPRIKELAALIAELKEAKKGTAIALEWQPPTGTVMLVNGAARGKPIAGEDFYRALLRVWLGEDPAQEDLKAALLGQAAEPGAFHYDR